MADHQGGDLTSMRRDAVKEQKGEVYLGLSGCCYLIAAPTRDSGEAFPCIGAS